MMVYVASFAISLGPIFWLLIAEIYPLQVRSSSEGLAATFNWGSNLLVSLTFLTLLQGIGAPKTFWLYGLCAIGAWIFSYRLVPETKGRTWSRSNSSGVSRSNQQPICFTPALVDPTRLILPPCVPLYSPAKFLSLRADTAKGNTNAYNSE